MAKIRTVKPELFRHEALFEAEQRYRLPLRLAFIGLFTCCDREGRFRWEPRSLKLDILPYDDLNFADVLDVLWQAGFIKKYKWQNKCYGVIPTWHHHQSINKHEPASKLPDPEKCVYETCVADIDTALHMQRSASKQKNKTVVENLPAPVSEPVHEVITFAPAAENQTMHTSMPEMHMHARALLKAVCAKHNDASAAHVHASLEMEVEMEVEEELEMEREVEVEREVEMEQSLGSNRHLVAPARRRSVKSAEVSTIFNHWKLTLQHLHAVLDKKRYRLIREALRQGYTVDQRCDVISGRAQTSHNLSENDHGQRYDGLHIILRNADQIDQFIYNCHNPPRPPNPADQLLRANTTAEKTG